MSVVGLFGLQLFSWATRSRTSQHSERTVLSPGEQREPHLDIYQTIAKAIADGDITPAYGVQMTKRYEELLQSTDDRKSAGVSVLWHREIFRVYDKSKRRHKTHLALRSGTTRTRFTETCAAPSRRQLGIAHMFLSGALVFVPREPLTFV
jgi:hypothetical protein